VDNVWLGMKKIGEKFIWLNGSELSFTNWATGNPSRNPDKNCAQITSDGRIFGKWVEVSCKKKNIVFCQKPQTMRQSIKKSMDKSLSELKKELEDTRKRSDEITLKFDKFIENLSSNQWINFKLFSDNEGEKKAFFIPLADNNYGKRWTDAVKLCENFNSTLVEIDSWQKHVIFKSYLAQLGNLGNNYRSFWINGHRDSTRKWEWARSGKDVFLKDWHPMYPIIDNDDYLAVTLEPNTNFGKFFNPPKKSTSNVVCELDVDFSISSF
jgi:hypothetical protein